MNKSNKFSPEVRERAVRMVQEHRGEYPSLWAAVESIAPKIGCVPQTLLEWVKREEVDTLRNQFAVRPIRLFHRQQSSDIVFHFEQHRHLVGAKCFGRQARTMLRESLLTPSPNDKHHLSVSLADKKRLTLSLAGMLSGKCRNK